MRKLLFFPVAISAILGCNGSGDMPCVDCAEPFPSSPSGHPSSPSGQSSSSGQQEPPIQISGSSSSFSEDHPRPSSSSISSPSVYHEGEYYETVVIGAQTWMARNLNVYNNFDDNPNGCGLYYNWATAMALENYCDTETCLPLGMVPPKHRGICPEGWHIPNYDDWNILVASAGGPTTAGDYLKEHGFLLCGYMTAERFYSWGTFGGWWSSSENGEKATYWSMTDKTGSFFGDDGSKSYGYNVRCVKN